MAKVVGKLVILIGLIEAVVANTCNERMCFRCIVVNMIPRLISCAVNSTRITFQMAFPGEFFGSSTAPTYCTDGTTQLPCSTEPLTLNRLTDGEYGDTSNGVNSSQFIAWNDSSRIALTRAGDDTLSSVRTVNLYFYHNPTVGTGLPEFTLSGSKSETNEGAPVPYTILDNQDLQTTDAQIRNVTLALTQAIMEEANRFHIRFSLMTGVQQFALSEVELCSDIGKQFDNTECKISTYISLSTSQS